MMQPTSSGKRFHFWIIAGIGAGLLLASSLLFMRGSPPPPPPAAPQPATGNVVDESVIDYNRIQTDPSLNQEMTQRKEAFGVGDGIDMVAKSNETLHIGDQTVAMADIARKIETREGRILETDLNAPDSASAGSYGIYVVQPGDNIWNIHFRILKDYFARKGIDLAPQSDEPVEYGSSSGVGRLLKFSERMVFIYNLKEKRLDADLDLILPLSKIVIYKMDRVFSVLDAIDYNRINHIRFDGDTLWIPSQQ